MLRFLFLWVCSHTDNDLFKCTWYFLQPNLQCKTQKEGSESEPFWLLLGEKTEYPSQKTARQPESDPHLFSCHFSKGFQHIIQYFCFIWFSVFYISTDFSCFPAVSLTVGELLLICRRFKGAYILQLYRVKHYYFNVFCYSSLFLIKLVVYCSNIGLEKCSHVSYWTTGVIFCTFNTQLVWAYKTGIRRFSR